MTYAAIYIKPEKPKSGIVDAVKATTIQGQLKQAFNSAKNNIKNFDLKSFANNLTLEGATDFTQKYATAGLTKIINGEPITSQSMMDGLFNGFAPAIDMTAVQMGYNSVKEMQAAVKSGNINVANFMQGFSGALSTVINNKKQAADYSYLGDEITIDMIIDIDRQNFRQNVNILIINLSTLNTSIRSFCYVLSVNINNHINSDFIT